MLYVIIEYTSFRDTFRRNRGTIKGVEREGLERRVRSRRRVKISGEGGRRDERNFNVFNKGEDDVGKLESWGREVDWRRSSEETSQM